MTPTDLIVYGAPTSRLQVPLRTLMAIAAEEAGSTLEEAASRSRSPAARRARQMTMWAARTCAGASLNTIAKAIGCHHTTVMYGIRQVEKGLAADPKVKKLCDRVVRAIAAGHPSAPKVVAVVAPVTEPKPAPVDPEPKPVPAEPPPCAAVRPPRANRDAQSPGRTLHGEQGGEPGPPDVPAAPGRGLRARHARGGVRRAGG